MPDPDRANRVEYRLVATLQRKGHWQAAIDTYQANIEMEPDRARHYNNPAWRIGNR